MRINQQFRFFLPKNWGAAGGCAGPRGKPIPLLAARQATTQAERDAAAAAFAADFGLRFPLVAAGMDGAFERAYLPWPIRLFALEGRRMAFVSKPVQCAPDLKALREFLLAAVAAGGGPEGPEGLVGADGAGR